MKRQIQVRKTAPIIQVQDERGLAKQRFARVQDLSYAQVREHTPIYDLEAYEKRLKKRKTQQFFKSLLTNSFILSTFVLTFSLLFIGE
ncbi:hypothetical protein [Acinetobacter seifertii]|uniref:Uncharacterized protein n=1 Tax=Acinetobacter seifertii TaxID=1530123 RepID=A0A7H2PPD9_9GAMM|nr:hypothetical protein [Acinetobacter seifertii]QNX04722.1 hypothetical protein IC796_15520 [Acinetobacter seifertii]